MPAGVCACYMQCLCMVVDAACKKNCETFQTLLDNLLLMLHTYVSVLVLAVIIICCSVNVNAGMCSG